MDLRATRVRCIGCGGQVPRMEGPTHRYMESSPGCWHVYGEVLAREYGDPAFRTLHRLTVDCFAVQHPGRPSAQSIQSVCIHLLGLCLVVERDADPAFATRAMQAVGRKKDLFGWLPPPASLGAVTVADVGTVSEPAEYAESVRAWAASAWSAWSEHHETVRRWLPTG